MNPQASQLTVNGSPIRNVNLGSLKQFAADNLSHRSALRTILLGERDEVPPVEFLAKLQVWLALLRCEEGRPE